MFPRQKNRTLAQKWWNSHRLTMRKRALRKPKSNGAAQTARYFYFDLKERPMHAMHLERPPHPRMEISINFAVFLTAARKELGKETWAVYVVGSQVASGDVPRGPSDKHFQGR